MDKFESENRKWREEKSRQLTAMLSAGEILPCEVRDMTGKLGRLASGKASDSQRERRRREGFSKAIQPPAKFESYNITQSVKVDFNLPQNLTETVVLSNVQKPPEIVKHPMCERPKHACVNCRDIFGQKCRWGSMG